MAKRKKIDLKKMVREEIHRMIKAGELDGGPKGAWPDNFWQNASPSDFMCRGNTPMHMKYFVAADILQTQILGMSDEDDEAVAGAAIAIASYEVMLSSNESPAYQLLLKFDLINPNYISDPELIIRMSELRDEKVAIFDETLNKYNTTDAQAAVIAYTGQFSVASMIYHGDVIETVNFLDPGMIKRR